jgi:mannose-1-phosphate guanylyltransferase
MNIRRNTWAIVLAGGKGSRLHTLTTNESDVSVPKQFCSLQGGRSLLHEALARARVVASPERICVVVAEQHRPWWKPALASMSNANIIVQLEDCGTAIGILLPLLYVMSRDSQARILLLASDHQA